MDCIKCGKKAKISLPNLNACNGCFLKIIDKRVRKEIRTNELIKKDDRILIIDDGGPESKVSIFLLQELIRDPTVKLKIKKATFELGKELKGAYKKIVVPWNADREAEYFLSSILENKQMPYLGHYKMKKKSYLKPLLHVLEQEAEIFCSLKKIYYAKIKKKRKSTLEKINNLEKEYPEIKFSLIKSSEEIKKIKKINK